MVSIPEIRIRRCNEKSIRADGAFVLYWMIANRRASWNFSLQRAVALAHELAKPLVVLEALRCDYRWASDRLHKFIIDGMLDNAAAFRDQPVLYYPYLEPEKEAGKGLLAALSEHACAIVTDDFPCFMLPRMVDAAAAQVGVRLEKIDSNGLLPIRATDKSYPTAYTFRQYLQKTLRDHLEDVPLAEPLHGVKLPALDQLPEQVTRRWPPAQLDRFGDEAGDLSTFPIDHDVPPVEYRGGSKAAAARLHEFLDLQLQHYAEVRNEPQRDVTSRLSPYLHFGHIAVHQVFTELAQQENWSPEHLAQTSKGNREGWWGMSKPAEAFLDELITWREVGYNMCATNSDYNKYESLPDWARETLADHAGDKRAHTYSLQQFEAAETHDELWNAAQRQLLVEGRIHNYLRMLWGKKILEWSASPQDALEVMIELNNKYAVDGRNPNSYSGIFWTLGRYDRPWGPERKIFGKIRYMSSENTARKVDVKKYIKAYGNARIPSLFD